MFLLLHERGSTIGDQDKTTPVLASLRALELIRPDDKGCELVFHDGVVFVAESFEDILKTIVDDTEVEVQINDTPITDTE